MKVLTVLLSVVFPGWCALALVAQTRLFLGLSAAPGWLDAFVFCGTVFGYHCTHPDRRVRALVWLAGVAGVLAFIQWANSPIRWLVAAVPALLWLAYYGFRRPGNSGLRSWQWSKPLTVATAWAWVTVLLPLDPGQWSGVWWMFLGRAAFVYALALAYDLGDVQYDRRFGLLTLALQLDRNTVIRIMHLALAVSGTAALTGFAGGFYDLQELFIVECTLIAGAWWLPFLLERDDWKPWQKILIDALMLVPSCVALLLR